MTLAQLYTSAVALAAISVASLVAASSSIKVVQTAELTNDRLTVKDDVQLNPDLPDNGFQTITIKRDEKYQSLRGFGGAFTDSTAWLFSQLPEDKQEEVLEAYFGESGHKYTLCRLTIGSTDFSLDHYNYDNTTDDYDLIDFSIDHDREYIIPMIKRAIDKRKSFSDSAVSGSTDDINFLSTPWSPPAWMKRNFRMANSLMPGLRQEEEVFKAWANYFSKYITEYDNAGVPVSYVTVQNEPHVAVQVAVTYECCGFESVHERDFLRDYLGPQLRADHPDVKIFIHDDQKDERMIDMVDTVMADAQAAKYVDGVAFHWYGDWGDNYDILDYVHEAYPELPLLGTEATLQRPLTQPLPWSGGFWAQGQQYAIDIIRDLNHNAEGWIDWNMILDRQGGPSNQHLGGLKDLGNCDAPIRVNLTGYPWVDKSQERGDGTLLYGAAYWHYGHFTRYMPVGSVRVGYDLQAGTNSNTSTVPLLETVAVVTPAASATRTTSGTDAATATDATEGEELVVVVLNANDEELVYNINVPEYGAATITMPAQSIQTLILNLD